MPTKKQRQRIAALVSEGMPRVEAEFQVAKEDLEAEERAVEGAAIEIIKRDFPDVWETAIATARENILKRERRKAKKKVDTEPTDRYDELIASRTAQLPDTARRACHDEMAASIIARLHDNARLIIDWTPYGDDCERLFEIRQCSDCQRVTTLDFMVKFVDDTLFGRVDEEVCTHCTVPLVNRLWSAGISVDVDHDAGATADTEDYDDDARLFEQSLASWVRGLERHIRAKLPATGHLASVLYPGADDRAKRNDLVECTFCGGHTPIGWMGLLVDDGDASVTDHPVYAAACTDCHTYLQL